MASKNYLRKYRKLRSIYEQTLGKKVSDITWYRLVASMKRHLGFAVENPSSVRIVRSVAQFKLRYKRFSFTHEDFQECWEVFKKYRNSNQTFTCGSFLHDLTKTLEIKEIPRSTKYHWFSRCGLSYSANRRFNNNDFALVALGAAKWALNKRIAASNIKYSQPRVDFLTIEHT